MESTWEHRAITGGSIALIAMLFGKGVSEVGSLQEASSSIAACLFAYTLSGVHPLPSSAVIVVGMRVSDSLNASAWWACRLSDGYLPLERGQLRQRSDANCRRPDRGFPGPPPEAVDHHAAAIL